MCQDRRRDDPGLGLIDRVAGRPTVALLGAAAAIGVALRVYVYRSSLGTPDSDEAVVGLMVRHFSHGEVTTFFWGQPYGGTQEVFLTVPLFVVASSSWLALRIVPIVLSAVACAVVWRVGRRTIGERQAIVAAALLWIWPPFAVFRLTHQWGFYAASFVYCGLILLQATRIAERPTRGRLALFGLTVGLGLWESEQLLPIVVATVAWLVWRRRNVLRDGWVAVLGAVVGGLPSIIWNARHGWASLHSSIEDTTTYQHRIRIFLSPLLSMMLGLRTPFSQQLLPPAALFLAAFFVLVGLFVWGAWRFRRTNASLLYVCVLVYPFVYAYSPETLLAAEPRYLMVLAPVLALLVAQLAKGDRAAVAVLVAGAALSAVVLHRMNAYVRSVPSNPPMAPRDIGPLIRTLDRLHVNRLYADFWVAYRLDFETRERIIASQSKLRRATFVDGRAIASHHPAIRYRQYERKVDATPGRGFVFFRVSTGRSRFLIDQLTRHDYRRTVVGPFVVYSPPTSG
jgi:hypothetical protein